MCSLSHLPGGLSEGRNSCWIELAVLSVKCLLTHIHNHAAAMPAATVAADAVSQHKYPNDEAPDQYSSDWAAPDEDTYAPPPHYHRYKPQQPDDHVGEDSYATPPSISYYSDCHKPEDGSFTGHPPPFNPWTIKECSAVICDTSGRCSSINCPLKKRICRAALRRPASKSARLPVVKETVVQQRLQRASVSLCPWVSHTA